MNFGVCLAGGKKTTEVYFIPNPTNVCTAWDVTTLDMTHPRGAFGQVRAKLCGASGQYHSAKEGV